METEVNLLSARAVRIKDCFQGWSSLPLLQALLLTSSGKGDSSHSQRQEKKRCQPFPHNVKWRKEAEAYGAGKDFKPRPPALC